MPETVTGKGLSQLPNDPDVMAAGLEYRDSNPLHEATIGGHLEIVQRLIDPVFSLDEKGPNVYSVMCMAPLYLAAQYKQNRSRSHASCSRPAQIPPGWMLRTRRRYMPSPERLALGL